MARLDGYQSTKSMAKHKDRPNPKRTTSGEENDAEPPNGIPVERPEPNFPGTEAEPDYSTTSLWKFVSRGRPFPLS
jgi:hypothetical protein